MNNTRRNFIKATGLLGAASFMPLPSLAMDGTTTKTIAADCTLIPSETAGPFPLDLTANTFYLRQDIRESQQGVPLNLRLKVLGVTNCQPMSNVRVNIWHCNKDGVYSGYNTNNNPGDASSTFLRGYQITDAQGEVTFKTIFPGWYNGRITHIHFQVYVSSSYSAVSQLTFDIEQKNTLFTAHKDIYTKGNDPLTFSSDNIFSDGYTVQLATLTRNETTGEYESYMEIAVQGEGTLGVGHIEKENAKYFSLGQNYPNPYHKDISIPLTLHQSGRVVIELFDLNGKKLLVLHDNQLSEGDHTVSFTMDNLGLPVAPYLYQITFTNIHGTFTDIKMMTPQ
jgi:protocatechuate 3,4-dioxygenase beta subunit